MAEMESTRVREKFPADTVADNSAATDDTKVAKKQESSPGAHQQVVKRATQVLDQGACGEDRPCSVKRRRSGLTKAEGEVGVAEGPGKVPQQSSPKDSHAEMIVFDLETTDLPRDSHIVQIAAVGNGRQFNRYVLPKEPMNPEASGVNGITCSEGHLYYRGKEVEALPIRQALEEFCDFLGKEPIILIGHNIISFDSQVLFNAGRNCGMETRVKKCLAGFLDTLQLFKAEYPRLRYHNQVSLVRQLLGERYVAHNGLEDVLALRKLLALVPLPKQRKYIIMLSLGSGRARKHSD